MNLDNTLFDAIQLLAEESPRRRMHYDLRTEADAPAGIGHENWKDMSQRILNVMMPDTDVPIHKHSHTSETIIICRCKVRCECYAEDGTKISEHVLEAGGECPGLQIPMGVYHMTRCIEPGSVIFEAKDRPYDPVETEEYCFFWGGGQFLNKAFDYGSKGCKFVTSHYQGCFSSKE